MPQIPNEILDKMPEDQRAIVRILSDLPPKDAAIIAAAILPKPVLPARVGDCPESYVEDAKKAAACLWEMQAMRTDFYIAPTLRGDLLLCTKVRDEDGNDGLIPFAKMLQGSDLPGLFGSDDGNHKPLSTGLYL